MKSVIEVRFENPDDAPEVKTAFAQFMKYAGWQKSRITPERIIRIYKLIPKNKMETSGIFLIIVIAILLFGWITSIRSRNEDRRLHYNHSLELNNQIADKRDCIEELTVVISTHEDIGKAILETCGNLKEELRVTKGNFTRYKNRDTKKGIEIAGYVELLKQLNYKVTGGEHKLNDNKEKIYVVHANQIPPTNAPKVELCNCMNPIKGVGNNCKTCRKPLK